MQKEHMMYTFFHKVPELYSTYHKFIERGVFDETDGPYILWMFGLLPCIRELLEEAVANYETLKRVFAYFEEELAASEDEDVLTLLYTGIFESIDDRQEHWGIAMRFLKPKTQWQWKLYKEVSDSIVSLEDERCMGQPETLVERFLKKELPKERK